MSEATFEKLPALETFTHCASCPPKPSTADLGMVLHPGFGGAGVTCDGDDRGIRVTQSTTLADIERIAAISPENDWRVHIDAPLYSAVYQRQGEGEWVLVEKGQGFA